MEYDLDDLKMFKLFGPERHRWFHPWFWSVSSTCIAFIAGSMHNFCLTFAMSCVVVMQFVKSLLKLSCYWELLL